MCIRKILLLAVCLIGVKTLYAGDVVRVKGAVGRWEVSDDITPKQAEEKALFEAKKEALRKAGVMENVWSVFGQVSATHGDEFFEAYSSVSAIAIDGKVNIIDKKVEDLWDQNLHRNYKILTIDAYVTKDEVMEDKTYAMSVEGIEPIYKENEFMRFTVKVHGADSYLKVLWFGEGGAGLIFPTPEVAGNENRLFMADVEYQFPLPSPDLYLIGKADPAVDVEKVNVIIVATKKDYLFDIKEPDYQSIIQWIYNIPADERTLFHTLTLIK